MTAVPGNQCAKSLPSVAVIIPCYNAEKWVAQAIQSVLDQDYPNLEVIVIDDGSTDGSLDVIRSFGDRIRWETGPNRGACAARNRGLALTEAEYVVFLDADDWLVDGAIRGQVSRASALDPGSRTIVFGSAFLADAEGQELPVSPNPWIFDGQLASKVWIMLHGPRTTAPLHRRELLLEVGGFRDGMPAAQEYDLHVRLMENGVEFLHHGFNVYYVREHSSPTRITNRPREQPSAESVIEHLERVLRRCEPLNSLERCMIAKYAWNKGRTYLRQGLPGSDSLFAFASEIGAKDYVDGGRLYRVACKLLGPKWAERISSSRAWIARAVSRRTGK